MSGKNSHLKFYIFNFAQSIDFNNNTVLETPKLQSLTALDKEQSNELIDFWIIFILSIFLFYQIYLFNQTFLFYFFL